MLHSIIPTSFFALSEKFIVTVTHIEKKRKRETLEHAREQMKLLLKLFILWLGCTVQCTSKRIQQENEFGINIRFSFSIYIQS